MKALVSILLVSLVVGCSTSPDVVQVGVNRYLSSVTSAAGAAASASGMKVKAIRKAGEFAQKHGGIAVETESKFNRPAVGFPTYDYYFKISAP